MSSQNIFQKILDRLVERVPEAIVATFNDRDGECLCRRNIEMKQDAIELLGAYRNVVKRHLQQAVEEFDSGEVEQIAFCTAQHWILMMGAQEQCSLVLVMRRDGLLGRARFEMDRALEGLNAEL
jgi:predicted regulator of Ras-like GTPase activity (Roadblock/LC7/MglB family)